ncbi:unnamed protein product [Dovyalis caffra]|uniref:Uncharacterized protein n=1 Tax=Dovyalis caffra TaxID=77055 RepID=A0AAV1S3U5_9ROSI|nr:unnamed protein product [Dovyalis caffra]
MEPAVTGTRKELNIVYSSFSLHKVLLLPYETPEAETKCVSSSREITTQDLVEKIEGNVSLFTTMIKERKLHRFSPLNDPLVNDEGLLHETNVKVRVIKDFGLMCNQNICCARNIIIKGTEHPLFSSK